VQLNPRKTGVRRAAGMIFLCGILLAPILRAQGTSRSSSSSSAREEEEQPPFLKRFSAGVRFSILTLSLQSGADITSNPNTQTTVAQSLTPATQRFGGGVTVEYAATRRILISADLLYRYFGYSAQTVTNVTLADGTSQITTLSEASHARYWDLPILARYTTLPARMASARVFLGGGAVIRRISNIRTDTTVQNPDGTEIYNYTPRTPQLQTTYGPAAVAGFRVKDDFGIKITPEVRYTRWLSDLFTAWPAKQRRNELEVVIGLTF
jgi:hypothetical protein